MSLKIVTPLMAGGWAESRNYFMEAKWALCECSMLNPKLRVYACRKMKILPCCFFLELLDSYERF